MPRVIVVFADGSKRLAHNLDDTRERWELRKEVCRRELELESERGYAVVQIDQDTPFDEYLQYQAVLVDQLSAIKTRIAGAPRGSYLLRHLYAVSDTIREQLQIAKQIAAHHTMSEMERNRQQKHQMKRERIEAAEQEVRDILFPYARKLERALLDAGLPLPEKPMETWMSVDELDEFSRLRSAGVVRNLKDYRQRMAEGVPE